jgi:hypothetical protein
MHPAIKKRSFSLVMQSIVTFAFLKSTQPSSQPKEEATVPEQEQPTSSLPLNMATMLAFACGAMNFPVKAEESFVPEYLRKAPETINDIGNLKVVEDDTSWTITGIVEEPEIPVLTEAIYIKPVESYFNLKFASIIRTILFNQEWATKPNFAAMLEDPELISDIEYGEQVRCCDYEGRRMIITGTALGPVIVYQHDVRDVMNLSCTGRSIISQFFPITETVSEETAKYLLGEVCEHHVNISHHCDVFIDKMAA